jgi:hypothetical protein
MKLNSTLSLKCARVLFMILAVFLNLVICKTAEAGRMKEIQYLHLEAIATHLFGQPDTEGLVTRKTEFISPDSGYFKGVMSEVLVYSSVVQDFEWVECKTMINRTESGTIAGVPQIDYRVAKTVCN